MRVVDIFTPESTDIASQPFYLFPDTVAVIRGYNFDGAKVGSGFKYTPAACLHMVKLTPYTIPDGLREGYAGWYPIPFANTIEYSTLICPGGCPWSISASRNMALLDIPGDYQFVLSHESLVSVVELTARVYPKSDFYGTEAKTLYFGG